MADQWLCLSQLAELQDTWSAELRNGSSLYL